MQKKSLHQLLSPLDTFRDLWKYRDLLFILTQRNIALRYKGTLLGFFWLLITPISMLAVYLFVFIVIFKAQGTNPELGDSKAAYALLMFCGITIFNIFAEAANTSTISISGNSNYVKKTIFPLEALPFATVMSTVFFGLLWCVILMVSIGFFLHKIYLTAFVLPFILLCLFLFCCGIAWFMAAIGVYIRDIIYVVSVVVQLLFFATPICYSLAMVPECFRTFMYLNPLTVLVSSTQQVLILGHWPNWSMLGLVGLASLIVFQAGYCFFMRTKGWFADVL